MARKLLLAAAAAAVALGSAGQATAGYPEKDITFLIPFSPGGGMDSTARQIASVLPKYLPNKVNVVPKNEAGAGGRLAMGQLYRAKPDGYTISVFNIPGAAMPQMTGEKVSYDITKVVWIGRMSTSPYLLGVSAKSDIKTIEDIKKLGRPLKIASVGFGTTVYTAASIAKSVIGFKAAMVTGYKGTRNIILGVIRGDADAAIAPTQTFASFVRSGDIRGVVTFEEKSSYPGVQTIAEAGYPQLTGLGVERLIGAPPGLPAEIQKILSDAVGKAIQDPESVAWAKKTKRPFAYLPAEKTQAAVDRALKNLADYPDALKEQK
jgi:tripartite-type tricarboxylate transporter receptor subunit TctC